MAPRLLISNQSLLLFSFKAPSPQTKAPQTTVAEQEAHDEVFGKEATSAHVRYVLCARGASYEQSKGGSLLSGAPWCIYVTLADQQALASHSVAFMDIQTLKTYE